MTPGQKRAVDDLVRAVRADVQRAIRAATDPLLRRIEELERSPFKYLGTYEAGRTYEANNFVTLDGSIWACTARTTARPGAGEPCWKLAVKAGQDRRR
jgi:hypothetical protein